MVDHKDNLSLIYVILEIPHKWGGSIKFIIYYLLLFLSNLNKKNEMSPEKIPAPTEIIILVIMFISE